MLFFLFFFKSDKLETKGKIQNQNKQKSKSKQKMHWHKGRQETDKWEVYRKHSNNHKSIHSAAPLKQWKKKRPCHNHAVPFHSSHHSISPSHFNQLCQPQHPAFLGQVMHQRFCNSIPTQQATPTTCNCKPPILIHMHVLQPTDTVQELWSLLMLVRALGQS